MTTEYKGRVITPGPLILLREQIILEDGSCCWKIWHDNVVNGLLARMGGE